MAFSRGRRAKCEISVGVQVAVFRSVQTSSSRHVPSAQKQVCAHGPWGGTLVPAGPGWVSCLKRSVHIMYCCVDVMANGVLKVT